MMPERTVLVCQHETCSHQGAAKVLAIFQAQAPDEVEIQPAGCMGQCGSGPMALVLPDQIWYSALSPRDAARITEQHLRKGEVVTHKLSPHLHPAHHSNRTWLMITAISVGLVLFFLGLLASQSYYI